LDRKIFLTSDEATHRPLRCRGAGASSRSLRFAAPRRWRICSRCAAGLGSWQGTATVCCKVMGATPSPRRVQSSAQLSSFLFSRAAKDSR
jgi:hypothetical protein